MKIGHGTIKRKVDNQMTGKRLVTRPEFFFNFSFQKNRFMNDSFMIYSKCVLKRDRASVSLFR